MAGRGNIPPGKVQRAFYISKELADSLRIEAAKRNVSQSAIVERALRRELSEMAQDRTALVEIAVRAEAVETDWWESVTALSRRIRDAQDATTFALSVGLPVDAPFTRYSHAQKRLGQLSESVFAILPLWEAEEVIAEARKLPGWQEGLIEIRPVSRAGLR